jgi:hypothetical protein
VALPDLFTISDFGLRRQEAVTGTADLKTVTFEGDTAGAAPSRTVLLASSHLQEDATAKVVVIAMGLDEVARRLSDCSPVVRGSTLAVDGIRRPNGLLIAGSTRSTQSSARATTPIPKLGHRHVRATREVVVSRGAWVRTVRPFYRRD